MKKINFYIAVILIAAFSMADLSTFAQGTWTQKANPPTAIGNAVSFAISNKGYISTGTYATGKELWEYDQLNDTWSQLADFPGLRRTDAVAFTIGNNGYVGTGWYGSTYYHDFWEYNPSTNTWMQKANFGGGSKTYAASGFSINGIGYVVGGGTNELWQYDTTNDIWSQKAFFPPGGRYYGVAFAIGQKGYYGTGFDTTSVNRNDFWEFDPSLNQWNQQASVPGGLRSQAVGWSIGNWGYIGTGVIGGSSGTYDFFRYDPISNSWLQKDSVGGGVRWNGSGFVINNKGYIGIGNYDDLWEYAPDTVTGINEINTSNFLFDIYPNPLTSSSILQLNIQLKNAEVVIYDVLGKEMMRKKMDGNRMEIEKGSLASGVYFVRVRSEEKQCVEKMVVE
jgi:N-acetylneuraminic acid mutarotase